MTSALTILERSVKVAVGDRAEPRPSQVLATERIQNALRAHSHVIEELPTGSGKSMALLSAAAERAVNAGERSLISTESLSLQKQILDKDAPDLVRAVEELTGTTLSVAVLKGTANYIDPRQLLATAETFCGEQDVALGDWPRKVYSATVPAGAFDPTVDTHKLRALLVWAFAQYAKPGASGDRHSCPVQVTDAEWSLISADASSAAGEDDTAYLPKAVEAKMRVAAADIVVVNHTLLAIQAANGIPVVTGNKNYGEFHHLLIDEAHALPDEVRKQGAAEVSARAIRRLIRAVTRVSSSAKSWAGDGDILGQSLDAALRARLSGRDTFTVPRDDDPLGDLGLTISAWARRAGKLVKAAADSPDAATSMKGKRAQSAIDTLCAAVSSVTAHSVGEARWVECEGGQDYAVRSSPVDVAPKLRRGLYVVPTDDPEVSVPLGVAAVSATLPRGFGMQAGLDAEVAEHESPFADAYAHSALFIPSGASDGARRALLTQGRMDTKRHTAWAAGHICSLVRANRGSALILAATSAAGREYVAALRRTLPELTVLSQWDGGTPAGLVTQWREDVSSVLVGTRSLMTGVDGPGDTCSLVVLDRIPRKPSNPVDDARVEQIVERGAVDKWAADRMVYASDAALLEAQAVGRLIRAASDRGMACVLDPRLLKYPNRDFPSYPEPTRQTYMKPLYGFGGRLTDLDDAVRFLSAR